MLGRWLIQDPVLAYRRLHGAHASAVEKLIRANAFEGLGALQAHVVSDAPEISIRPLRELAGGLAIVRVMIRSAISLVAEVFSFLELPTDRVKAVAAALELPDMDFS